MQIINSGSRIVGAYETVVAEKEERIKFLLTRTDVDATRKELDRQKDHADSWEVSATANRESADDYAAQVERIISGRSVTEHAAELTRSRAAVMPEVQDISLERIRSYLVALHAQEEVKAQLCYRCGARISLEKMVEAEYELPPGLLGNYTKEEKEYLAKVESFNSLGNDTLFPTPPPPPTSLPRDVASQVPEGISKHGSFLSPQDNQDGDQV
ncbi:hypothetical protein AALP_AA2G055000 [Arabis alpina]|uniref:Uncharacterized protein n=1 Tax=Arabis alpina TaxID=50452 RepID=A0A087HFI2_ARAAL|nr:hypothetical protein AALP_AA2G055000 [Arabis alpina]